MGGFGALNLAVRHPGRVCAAGGQSAALWRTGGQTPEGAFDDAQDFARNDVLGDAGARRRPFGRTRVWLSIGASDPFVAANRALAALLRKQGQAFRYHETPGEHSSAVFWRHATPAFRFYAAALAAC
jgi:S-formylglutathione hydrolase FrmB